MAGTLFFLCWVVGLMCWNDGEKLYAVVAWLLSALWLFVTLANLFGGGDA